MPVASAAMPPTSPTSAASVASTTTRPIAPIPAAKIGLGPRHGDEPVEERGQRHEGPHPPRRLNADERRAERGAVSAGMANCGNFSSVK
jgi:hypothetical protein